MLSIATLAPTADLRSGIGSVARQVGQRDAGQLTLPSFKASMTSTSSPPALCTLVSLCAISVLPLSIFLPSLPNIAADFHTDYAFATLALSGYALISAGIELVTGPLSDRFGRRPLLLTGLAVFVVGSIGCAVSTNAWTFLVFRALQAPITSCYPLSMAVIRDTTGRQKTASRIGYVVMAAALAPMLGPTLGGTLDRFAGWRAIFWSLALLGTTLLVICWFDLEETHTKTSDTFRQRLLAYTALLRERRFWGYSLCMAFSTGTFYAFLSGAPLAAKVAFELPTAQLGFYMGTITAGFVLGSFVSARYATRYPLTAILIVGRVIACAGPLIALALFLAGVKHAIALFGPCMLVGIGNGLSNPCAHAGAISLRPDLAGSASGLIGAMTIAGGSALSSATGALLTENNAVYAPLCLMLLSSLVALSIAVYVHVSGRY